MTTAPGHCDGVCVHGVAVWCII